MGDAFETLRAAALCTIDHEALKLDDVAWSKLRPVGVQQTYDDTPGEPRTLDCRDCTCGSTLCRPLELNPPREWFTRDVEFPCFVTDQDSPMRHVSRETLNVSPVDPVPRGMRERRRARRKDAMRLRLRRGRR